MYTDCSDKDNQGHYRSVTTYTVGANGTLTHDKNDTESDRFLS